MHNMCLVLPIVVNKYYYYYYDYFYITNQINIYIIPYNCLIIYNTIF